MKSTDHTPHEQAQLSFLGYHFFRSFVLSWKLYTFLVTPPEEPKVHYNDQALKLGIITHLTIIAFRVAFFMVASYTSLIPQSLVIFMAIETILPILLYSVKAINEIQQLLIVRTHAQPQNEWPQIMQEGYVLAANHLINKGLLTTYPHQPTSLSDIIIARWIVQANHADPNMTQNKANPKDTNPVEAETLSKNTKKAHQPTTTPAAQADEDTQTRTNNATL